MELGLVPGINPDYFRPLLGLGLWEAQNDDSRIRRLSARGVRRQPGRFHFTATIFTPITRTACGAATGAAPAHPPLWMMSRDPQTLEFCAANGINPGYFLVYPRADAAPAAIANFLADWAAAEGMRKS